MVPDEVAAVPTLSAEEYHSQAAHDRDREAAFGRSWLCLGPAATVRGPGSFTSEVVAGRPVVVVRDTDGTLRAFANVCPHRAGPLVADDDQGSCRSLACGYHGWTYGLDGRLRHARDSGLDDEALEGIGLRPLGAAEWRGLLFVHPDPTADPVEEWLEPGFVDHCAPFPIEEWSSVERIDHQIRANWKVYAENYLEGYHLPLVHPALTRAVDAGSYRVEAGSRWAIHHAPPRDGSRSTGVWLWHWPNLALNLYPGGGSIERWWPTSPVSCHLRLDFGFVDVSPAAMADHRLDIAASATICAEDRAICEVVQRNLESGAYQRGVLSPRHETAVAAFHRLVLQ